MQELKYSIIRLRRELWYNEVIHDMGRKIGTSGYWWQIWNQL